MRTSRWATVLLLTVLVLTESAITGRAVADPPQGQAPPALTPELASKLGKLIDRDWENQPEWAQMMAALLQGGGMRMGEGWFRPSQSRYGWKWLAERFDDNKDNRIVLDELPKSLPRELLLQRLDRDTDGAVTEADLNAPRPSSADMLANQLFGRFDQDSNGRVSKLEVDAFFAAADRGDSGFLTREDLKAALAPPPRPAPSGNAQMPRPTDFVAMLMKGELGSLTNGPNLDEAAPDFELATLDGKRKIALAEFRRKKPVVLVFGSFT